MDLALFDFDGTITTRETFVDFVKLATPRWRWRLGRLMLVPLVVGYRLGLLHVATLRSAVTWVAFAGVRLRAIEQAADVFAVDMIPPLLREQAMQRIAWHKARGDRVFVVSGSYDIALAPWCAAQGLELVASHLEVEGGVLTGRYLGVQCVSAEKCRRVRALLDPDAFARVHAYGDTREDLDLLALAHVRTYRWQPA